MPATLRKDSDERQPSPGGKFGQVHNISVSHPPGLHFAVNGKSGAAEGLFVLGRDRDWRFWMRTNKSFAVR